MGVCVAAARRGGGWEESACRVGTPCAQPGTAAETYPGREAEGSRAEGLVQRVPNLTVSRQRAVLGV